MEDKKEKMRPIILAEALLQDSAEAFDIREKTLCRLLPKKEGQEARAIFWKSKKKAKNSWLTNFEQDLS